LEGKAEVLVKWHEELEWQSRMLSAYDTCPIAPGVCHWLRWSSDDGYCVVFKARTIPGVGKPPNGQADVLELPPLQKRCVLPDGFNPE
jgi:hypothetical protein